MCATAFMVFPSPYRGYRKVAFTHTLLQPVCKPVAVALVCVLQHSNN